MGTFPRMALYDRDYMREGPPRFRPGIVRGISAFYVVLAINVVVFVLQFVFEIGCIRLPLTGEVYMPMGGVSVDELSRGHVWALFTYMFVHGNVLHFLVNMAMLWFIGRWVQERFGSRHFAMIYVLCGIMGAAAEMTVNGVVHGDTTTTLVGASASAFGLLMALAVVAPTEKITALFYFIIPVHLQLWSLAKGLFLAQLVLGLTGLLFNVLPEGFKIAYFAHLGGAVMGWFYARSLGYGDRPMTYASQWQPMDFQQQRKPAMARSRSRTVVDLENETVPLPPHRPQDPVTAYIEKEVDPLLDKMNQHGKDSLTADEQRKLEKASREVDRHRQGKAAQ
ncbi:rhomboid family intramembrane serine protease [Prosthecobacter sp.]|uniref:rhomboid family intramembrane serine protease n=1 Tax=Prosthecobacter sp. TaxID=1965333 RepID=UPI003783437B